MSTHPQGILAALNVLQQSGFSIPTELITISEQSRWKADGIQQVWLCKKCTFRVLSPLVIKASFCEKRHKMGLEWSKP